MRNRVAALVVGAGLMGRWHCDGVRAAGSVVVGVCDRDLDAARSLARSVGARAGTELSELMTQTRPDVVHVCAPLASHRPLAEAALRAGCHVVVEKPISPCLADTQALLSIAKDSGRLLCPVHQLAFQRWLPLAAEVGDPVSLDYSVCSTGGERGGSPLLEAVAEEILPHPLSLFERILPGCLAGADWSTLRVRPGELVAQAACEPLTLRISISLHGRPTRHGLVVTGSRGTLWVDLFHGFGLVERGHRSRSYKILRPLVLPMRGWVAAAANLTRRAALREHAYPGLRALIRAVHAAIVGPAGGTLSPEHTLAVAGARERIVRGTPGSGQKKHDEDTESA